MDRDPQPPGWYHDPSGSGWLRFWDGTWWTDRIADRPGTQGQHSPAPPRPSGWAVVLVLLAVTVALPVLLVGACLALLAGMY